MSDNLELMQAFTAAWGRKDLEAMASMLSEDAVYEASVGPEPGETFRGKAAVLAGCSRMFAHDDGCVSQTLTAWTQGNTGVSEWRFVWKDSSGERSVRGIDIFTFAEGKIIRKNAFRKAFAAVD